MKKMLAWSLVGVLSVAFPMTYGDVISEPKEPPREMTVVGKLQWETYKKGDGSTVKIGLSVVGVDGEKVRLTGPDGKFKTTKEGEKMDLESYLGKQVKITVQATEFRAKDGKKRIWSPVASITRIEEDASQPAPAKDQVVNPQAANAAN